MYKHVHEFFFFFKYKDAHCEQFIELISSRIMYLIIISFKLLLKAA